MIKIHDKDNLPSTIIISEFVMTEKWIIDSYLHSKNDKPSMIKTNKENGEVIKFWHQYDILHRGDDKPAIVKIDNDFIYEKQWYKDGKLHRENNPAIVKYYNEKKIDQYWYLRGQLHRDDGPAVLYDENQEWFQFGQLHREDGPAVIKNNGDQYWYQYGLLHRDNDKNGNNQPCVIKDNFKLYYKNGIIYNPALF